MELQITVQKRFAGFDLDLDFTVASPRTGIFGPSGSGKSTLVSLLAGLQQPDSGIIRIDGETLFETGKIDIPPEKRGIGIIFQHPHLFPHLNTRANLVYGLKRCPVGRRFISMDDLIGVLEIGHLLDRGVNRLSGGEKQRVAIGRAVLSNPRLLLMDEPLSALDDTLRFQIISHLKSVCKAFGIPFLFISHSLLEMRLMADQAVSVSKGRVSAIGTVEELARSRMGGSQVGYINLLELGRPEPAGNLFSYPWRDTRLLLTAETSHNGAIAELSSKDIMLFKKHPEAISARNLLACTVRSLFSSGRQVGVELETIGGTLIAEVVRDAVAELDIHPGAPLYAAIKASAFRLLPG